MSSHSESREQIQNTHVTPLRDCQDMPLTSSTSSPVLPPANPQNKVGFLPKLTTKETKVIHCTATRIERLNLQCYTHKLIVFIRPCQMHDPHFALPHAQSGYFALLHAQSSHFPLPHAENDTQRFNSREKCTHSGQQQQTSVRISCCAYIEIST